MKLSAAEARLLQRIREAGTAGLEWSQATSGTLGRLARKGLIECRMGETETTRDGSRTGMRFVATPAGEHYRD